jgi:hypothetical protein
MWGVCEFVGSGEFSGEIAVEKSCSQDMELAPN